jgi:hypothetical protein
MRMVSLWFRVPFCYSIPRLTLPRLPVVYCIALCGIAQQSTDNLACLQHPQRAFIAPSQPCSVTDFRLFAFHQIPLLQLRSARPMAIFLLAHARTCHARLLDNRGHTAHKQPTALVGPVQTALGSSHGCNPSAVCPSDRHILHPCVVAAHHILQASPPNAHLPDASGTHW